MTAIKHWRTYGSLLGQSCRNYPRARCYERDLHATTTEISSARRRGKKCRAMRDFSKRRPSRDGKSLSHSLLDRRRGADSPSQKQIDSRPPICSLSLSTASNAKFHLLSTMTRGDHRRVISVANSRRNSNSTSTQRSSPVQVIDVDDAQSGGKSSTHRHTDSVLERHENSRAKYSKQTVRDEHTTLTTSTKVLHFDEAAADQLQQHSLRLNGVSARSPNRRVLFSLFTNVLERDRPVRRFASRK